jgi:hypothetical protein
MRKAILIMILAIVSSNAAAEWVGVSYSGNFTVYADPTTIRRAGNMVKMSILVDLKKAEYHGLMPFMSMIGKDEFDCKEDQSRRLASSLYSGKMGEGAVVSSSSDPINWEPVPPRTSVEALWKFACGKR